MTDWIHHSFVESEKMLQVSMSSFEAEVLVRWWLGLIAAHEGMRMMGCYSPTEDRQDAYASDRCDAFVKAGLLSEGNLTSLKSIVFKELLEAKKLEDEAGPEGR
jgi:hypothetical protein